MMFTYCLVTKGRREYLPIVLHSLDTALRDSDVQVIVVDNGCPEDISQLLSEWCTSGDERKYYVRFEVNDTSPQRVWNLLRDFDVWWLNFPGDDDVIHPEFLEDARRLIDERANLNAIASSMRIIDAEGKPTGQIRKPLEYHNDRVQYMASSFHEPPFLFPALFINFRKTNVVVPHSRYIFDWWLSLFLISIGQIATTSKVSIDYRVHVDQESALAPNRRKFFEAQVVFSRFIQSDEFKNFLAELSDLDKLRFWKLIADRGPIYGDLEFGKPLMLPCSLSISDSMAEGSISLRLLGMFAAANGTFLGPGGANAFLLDKYSGVPTSGGNFRLMVAEGSCTQVSQLLDSTRMVDGELMDFIVGCRHASGKMQFIADCDLVSVFPQNVLDLLIVQMTNRLELDGVFDYKISPIERRIVSLLRSLKDLLPSKALSAIRKGIHG